MQKNPLPSLALILVLALPAHQALAQSTPASTPAKKELIARLIKLQRPGVEAMSRDMAARTCGPDAGSRGGCASTRIEPAKQEAVGKGIQVDVKKYLDETVPLVRDRALALAPGHGWPRAGARTSPRTS